MGVLPIYFVEVPGTPEQATAEWLDDTLRSAKSSNWIDLRPWFPEGAEALRKKEVSDRMDALGITLWQRIERARRAMAVPGNLRWMNPHFVGRRAELDRLHQNLALGTLGAVGVVTAVQGLGGQGKTELAVAYAHGFADSYPGGLWSLGTEGKKELLPLIGDLAWEPALGFTPSEAMKNDPVLLGRGVLEHLKRWPAQSSVRNTGQTATDTPEPLSGLSGPPSCLILLDNVSEPELLSPAQLATLPGGMGAGWPRIVATTRLDVPAQKNRLAVLAVDALDEDSALSLIRDHQPFRDAQKQPVADPEQSVPKGVPTFASDAEEAAAREIVRALGGFTLAVEQVALYLGLHPDVTPAAFLALLRARVARGR
jgi:hypothetical protein